MVDSKQQVNPTMSSRWQSTMMRSPAEETEQLSGGVREFGPLESTVLGRARLLPSRALAPEIRLSGSFALPIPGHPQLSQSGLPPK